MSREIHSALCVTGNGLMTLHWRLCLRAGFTVEVVISPEMGLGLRVVV